MPDNRKSFEELFEITHPLLQTMFCESDIADHKKQYLVRFKEALVQNGWTWEEYNQALERRLAERHFPEGYLNEK